MGTNPEEERVGWVVALVVVGGVLTLLLFVGCGAALLFRGAAVPGPSATPATHTAPRSAPVETSLEGVESDTPENAPEESSTGASERRGPTPEETERLRDVANDPASSN